jgi:hypothetical protein
MSVHQETVSTYSILLLLLLFRSNSRDVNLSVGHQKKTQIRRYNFDASSLSTNVLFERIPASTYSKKRHSQGRRRIRDFYSIDSQQTSAGADEESQVKTNK